MGFLYDAAGISENAGGCIPPGIYNLKIISAQEGTTQKGDPKVTVHYEVADGDFSGRLVKYHTVTFFNDKSLPAAGIAKGYLKALGLPHDGKFTVEPFDWIGRIVTAKVENKTSEKGTFPTIKYVNKYVVNDTEKKTEEDVPF